MPLTASCCALESRIAMLQFIRSKASSLFIKVLFFALIVAFGFWGIGDILHQAPPPATVARIGSTEISLADYQRQYQQQLEALSRLLGTTFTDDLAKQMHVPQSVLNDMVQRALYVEMANKMGMRVSADTQRHLLETNPAFFDQSGHFSRQIFNAYLNQVRMSEAMFVSRLGPQLLVTELQHAITSGAVPPQVLVDDVYRYRNEKRVASTLLIADAGIKDIPAPQPADLVKFHQDHPERYQAPEYRKISVLRNRVSDDEIAQEFKAHTDRYRAPGKRQFLTFTLLDEAAAKKAAADIAAGGDFATIAKKVSGADPIDTGLVEKTQMLAEMADPAYAAAQGAVIGPVQTALGWQIAKVMKTEPDQPRTLDQVKDEIRRALSQTGDVANVANQLDDTLAGGASLEDAAKKLNLTIENFPAVTRDGLDASGKPIGELIGSPQLLPTAFATETGQESNQVDDGAGGYFIVRVDAVTPASLRPLDQVKDKVLADWQAGARDKAAGDQATKIVERIKLGEDLAAIAKSMGLATTTSSGFTRDTGDQANGVSPALANLLFAVKKGQAATAPTDSGTNPGHVVAVVTDIQPANAAADADGTKKLSQELSVAIGQDIVAEFRKALESEIPVTLEPKALEGSTAITN
jgi:peptidyl-prolyl cis-trans isomerase D